MNKQEFTKYETARILGARSLQIAMNAPLLVELSEEELEKIHYNPMEIAKIEFEKGVLPIAVKQPMPKKKAVKVTKKVEEVKKEEAVESENVEEKEIAEKGEIMELANPEDEEYIEEESEGREASEELQ
ncbi:MAG: DNA-directed RNA polymerase subunit K [Candidatus Pacearchaeota archaeon]